MEEERYISSTIEVRNRLEGCQVRVSSICVLEWWYSRDIAWWCRGRTRNQYKGDLLEQFIKNCSCYITPFKSSHTYIFLNIMSRQIPLPSVTDVCIILNRHRSCFLARRAFFCSSISNDAVCEIKHSIQIIYTAYSYKLRHRGSNKRPLEYKPMLSLIN